MKYKQMISSRSSTSLRLGSVLFSASLVLGCDALIPKSIRAPTKPNSLDVVSTKGVKEYPPVSGQPVLSKPSRPPEIYPAKGNLLGPDGAHIQGNSGALPRKEGKYTLNFIDADISEVAKTILDDALKLNYVISPKVTGKVTMQTTKPLTDDELLPTLETLLKLNGAVLVKEDAGYKIEPDNVGAANAGSAKLGGPGHDLPPGYQIRVIPLKFVGAQEMQKILEPLLPPKSILKADARRNFLVVAGTSEQLGNVLENVQLFDADFMQGMSVGLFPVSNVEPTTLAFELEKVLGDTSKGPLAGVLKILPVDRLNAVLVMTTQPRYLKEVQSWMGRLDRYTGSRIGGVHVYRLQNVEATELAKTLANIFGTNASGQGNRPSVSPGSQGSQMGSAYSAANSVTNSYGDAGSSTAGDLGMGSANGGLNSGPAQGSGMSNAGGGMNSGMSSGSSGGSMGGMGGSSGGMGGSSGGMGGSSGGTGGGLGRSSNTASRSSTAYSVGGAKIIADPINNALIITAKAQEYQEIEAVIRELDVMPKQVLIDVTVAEVQLTDELQYGLKWYFQQGSSTYSLNGASIPTPPISNPLAFQYSLAMAGKDVRVLLSAEADKGKVTILSSPSVLVLNNQEAAIKVGDQVPILTGQYGNFTGGGSSTTTNPVYSSYNSIQYRDTGVLLNVRPRINSGGLVTMEIVQAVDDVKSTVSAGSSSDSSSSIASPTITQRQIKSSVAVHDGETLVLGGLIKENNALNRSGIPALYEVPVVGAFFGQTTLSNTKDELVVLLTPRVIENVSKGREVTNEFRRQLNGLSQDEPETTDYTPNALH
jgi:general secretion pathway protein D